MKNKLMVFMVISVLLSAWLVLAYASDTHGGEAGRITTVTLRIEGMT
jgi:hypothetical protein